MSKQHGAFQTFLKDYPDTHPSRYARRPRNGAEGALYDILMKAGLSPSKRGWPDFFIQKSEGIVVIEVKRNANHAIKHSQLTVMGSLACYGVPCFMWSPDGGFTKVLAGGKMIPASIEDVLGAEPVTDIVSRAKAGLGL